MIEMRTSRPEEVARQKEVWKLAFHDDDSFIDFYYDNYYKPDRVFVLEEDGEIKTMLATFPIRVYLPDGSYAVSAYFYALGTDPKDRKNGYGRRLFGYAEEYLQANGVDCATLVPSEPSMFRYFDTIGYGKSFSHRKVEITRKLLPQLPETGSIQPAAPNRYNRIRDNILNGAFYVAYPDELIQHQKGISQLANADIYELEVDGVAGVAAAEYLDDDNLLLKELVIPADKMAQAVALVAKELPALRYFVRFPTFLGEVPGCYVQTFGVVKWFNEELEQKWGRDTHGYLGLAFD